MCVPWARYLTVYCLSASSERVAWARCLNASSERVAWARLLSVCCLSAFPEHVFWACVAWARFLSALPERVAWTRLLNVCCLSTFTERVFWACVAWARCLSVSSNRVLTWVYIPLFLTQMALHSYCYKAATVRRELQGSADVAINLRLELLASKVFNNKWSIITHSSSSACNKINQCKNVHHPFFL